MAPEFGLSGTIYDSPPVHSEIFAAGAADLALPLGGGFQAAHVWVNNSSNQSLYLPDAPDVVPPGVTRVVAIKRTDVARASWNVPAQFAISQPQPPSGAAIIIWLNPGIDIAPTPGVSNQPLVSIAANQSVQVAGGTVNIGNTPTVQITGTPTVNIGNTPSVNIASGTVSIGNTAQVNIAGQSVNVSTQQPQQALADLNFPANQQSTQTTAAVPTGTHSLRLILRSNISFQFLKVTGHQSGAQAVYYPRSGSAPQNFAPAVIEIPVDSTKDTTYDVTAQNNSVSTPAVVSVVAILDTSAVRVYGDAEDPLPVQVVQTNLTGGIGARNQSTTVDTAYADTSATANPAAGSVASVVLNGVVSKAYRAKLIEAWAAQSGTTATQRDAQLFDGTNVVLNRTTGVTNVAGAISGFATDDTGIRISAGNAMKLAFAAGDAGVFQRVTLSAYLN